MRRLLSLAVFSAIAASPFLSAGAQEAAPKRQEAKPPLKERAAKIFDANDKANPPKEGAVVFLGSSSIAGWTTLVEDMAPLPVVKRGVGGTVTSQMAELYELAVSSLKPKAIVYYCGDNDLAKPSADPAIPYGNFVSFVAKVRAGLPKVKILFVSVKPSERRKDCLGVQGAFNQKVKELCEKDKGLVYLDVTGVTLAPDGKIRTEMLKGDGLHLNAEGYAGWTRVIKPAVEKALAEAAAE